MDLSQADLHPQTKFRQHARIISHVIIPSLNQMQQLLSGLNIQTFLLNILALFISLPLHEFAHAFVAVRLGDETPRQDGRLTLNPFKHLDLMGSLMLIIVGFGWAKPVRINPYAVNRKTDLGMMLVSLAGPLANFLLAILFAIPLRFIFLGAQASASSPVLEFIYAFFSRMVTVNLLLMLFNMLPLAPLDGEKVAMVAFPPKWGYALEKFSRYSSFILLALILLPRLVGFDLLGYILYPPLRNLMSILVG